MDDCLSIFISSNPDMKLTWQNEFAFYLGTCLLHKDFYLCIKPFANADKTISMQQNDFQSSYWMYKFDYMIIILVRGGH